MPIPALVVPALIFVTEAATGGTVGAAAMGAGAVGAASAAKVVGPRALPIIRDTLELAGGKAKNASKVVLGAERAAPLLGEASPAAGYARRKMRVTRLNWPGRPPHATQGRPRTPPHRSRQGDCRGAGGCKKARLELEAHRLKVKNMSMADRLKMTKAEQEAQQAADKQLHEKFLLTNKRSIAADRVERANIRMGGTVAGTPGAAAAQTELSAATAALNAI